MKKVTALSTSFALLFCSTAAFAAKPSDKMGGGLFRAKGSNSCIFCHGLGDEVKGNVKDAASLTNPKAWKAYAALGGDAAFKADPIKFRENLKKATVALIKNGGIRHNGSYKDPAFDWSKIKKYNAQMMGLSGTASVAWLKKYKDRGVTPDIAAESVFLFVTTLDKDKVFAE